MIAPSSIGAAGLRLDRGSGPGSGRRGRLATAAVARPRPVAMVVALGAGIVGSMVLIVVSSTQALVTMSDHGAALAQQEIDGDGSANPSEGSTTPSGSAAMTSAGVPAGQPSAPVGPEEVVSVEGIRVHGSIADQVRNLLEAARADGVNLSGWGWRDGQTQIRLRRQHCGTSDYAVYRMPSSRCSPPTARPGSSQHERGLAIDFTYNGGSISTRSNAGFRWLQANAAAYGFKNLASEPWHWSTTGR